MTRATVLLAVLLAAWLPAPAEDAPYTALPYTPSLEPAFLDREADPCEDLYQYACGGWRVKNPIPPDQSSWSVYGKAEEENRRYLWGLLIEAAKPAAGRPASRQKIGDYFAACMDTDAVEKMGSAPLRQDLDAILHAQSVKDLGKAVGGAHARGSSFGMLFGSGVEQDAKDSTKQIAAIYAAGLGLPDRDYYFKEDDRSKEIRARYVEHVRKVLQLLGDPEDKARAGADAVMRLETALAGASLTRVERRDPYKVYHRTTFRELKKLAPSFDWEGYFDALGRRPEGWLNVSQPEFVKKMDSLLRTEPLETLQTYLRYTLANAQAEYLSSPFADEDFTFYRAYLRGVTEQPPRWKRCVSWVDRDLGEALGKEFVEKVFPPETKGKTLEMTLLVEKAMGARIDALDWMDAKTKKSAKDKLARMRNKIGYPDAWRDYGPLEVKRDDFAGNVARAAVFENKRQLAKIGKPVDRGEWGMTPPTVNAYYNASMNDMNFPAGVLMPPLFDPKMDDAPNYGNTGSTIGHELTHGFDDEGRKFDADGNLRDWWTKRDGEEFERRAGCVRDQYAKYVIVDDIKINSQLTSGEDIADLGGTILAWVAWKEATKGKTLESRDGLTPEQRFFVGLAQWACENQRDENLRVNAATNPHSPGRYRINGLVANMPEFAEAFRCEPGDALFKKPEDVCRVW
jgi:endothelin-converting enzyme/putative endopeptidase